MSRILAPLAIALALMIFVTTVVAAEGPPGSYARYEFMLRNVLGPIPGHETTIRLYAEGVLDLRVTGVKDNMLVVNYTASLDKFNVEGLPGGEQMKKMLAEKFSQGGTLLIDPERCATSSAGSIAQPEQMITSLAFYCNVGQLEAIAANLTRMGLDARVERTSDTYTLVVEGRGLHARIVYTSTGVLKEARLALNVTQAASPHGPGIHGEVEMSLRLLDTDFPMPGPAGLPVDNKELIIAAGAAGGVVAVALWLVWRKGGR
ncbi:hypothetical protein Pyrfu_0561 [Pyrolobus fumarii 1A]|uniref:Uncharacterized protein n=1 Tax=Pyrolobus fumarii (strain DSM 11204 / 1A) TaxID=694429 RepID=G0EGY1_PYRF1|nr:hypothetical protein [Pyrolobus fumarii]AEM38431.1 hypothetical protein Pyrfu_0561 [Pyrolobus fumarii 1A]